MADRQQMKRAIRHHDRLLKAQKFSVEPCEGMAMVCIGDETVSVTAPGDPEHWHQEAFRIVRERAAYGLITVIATKVTKAEMIEYVQDETISDIICIGHGGFQVFSTYPTQDELLDNDAAPCLNWKDVSEATTHLKLGQFVQRTCGIIHESSVAALGTFAVSDKRNVILPAGHYFLPEFEGDSAEGLLQSPYSQAVNTLEDFRNIAAKVRAAQGERYTDLLMS